MLKLYDFQDFLNRMAALDYHDIVQQADAECSQVERVSYGMKSAPHQRELGSVEYAVRIKAFLFFMRFKNRPGSASDGEFQSYKLVVEVLVKKGQWKAEALDAFR